MIAPGALVICTPFFVGFLFGTQAVAGLLAGEIVSGVQIAISFSNTGGAWDNTKKYIESGVKVAKQPADEGGDYIFVKHTEAHRASVVGDTVGDPLKDTSGPSINILMKLSAILSLVFASFFKNSGGILMK
jgi:Na+/H+-translocating membrane pyrophosphatase